MIPPQAFFSALASGGVSFFAGVPDSLLKPFCTYVAANARPNAHVICQNEGGAIALAAGHHFATGEVPLVYMQNSGLGNAVNPLLSLVDPLVYSIPLLLLIGWRGEPGRKDEPQHAKQGAVTLALLDAMQIPYHIVDDHTPDLTSVVREAVSSATTRQAPHAFVARAGAFEPCSLRSEPGPEPELNREAALRLVLSLLSGQDAVVTTTGMLSREVFEIRESRGEGHGNDLLTVGSMGHASLIALGVAKAAPSRQVYCLDGDGAALMHMGSLAIIGAQSPANLRHVVFNNGAHDSVGGQPTVGFEIDLPAVALACRYRVAYRAETAEQVRQELARIQTTDGPGFLEIRLRRGARADLGRPTSSPVGNKREFMRFLKS